MAATTVELPDSDVTPTVRDRLIDAARQAAHLTHETELLKTLAADAMDDGVDAARRAMTSLKRGVERVEDFGDDTAHWIRRRPLKAVTIGAGAGVVLGIVAGLLAGRALWRVGSRV